MLARVSGSWISSAATTARPCTIGERQQDRADAVPLRHPAPDQGHEHDADRLPEPQGPEGRADASLGSQGRRLGPGEALDDGAADAVLGEQDDQEAEPDRRLRAPRRSHVESRHDRSATTRNGLRQPIRSDQSPTGNWARPDRAASVETIPMAESESPFSPR